MWSLACLALLISTTGAIPIASKGQNEGSAEQLLAQIRQVQQQPTPDSDVVGALKEQLGDQMDSIKLSDETDRSNLPDEVRVWESRVDAITDSLSHSQEKLQNLTVVVDTKTVTCDNLASAKNEESIVVDGFSAAVGKHDELFAKEQAKSRASIDAIDRDLEIMKSVQQYLIDAAAEAAAKAEMEPTALKHQVVGLMGDLTRELQQGKESAESQWSATSTRLTLESSPVRQSLTEKQQEMEAMGGRLSQCRADLQAAQQQVVVFRDETIKQMERDLSDAKATLDSLQPEFDSRHNAREKRLAFLRGLLEQLQNH